MKSKKIVLPLKKHKITFDEDKIIIDWTNEVLR